MAATSWKKVIVSGSGTGTADFSTIKVDSLKNGVVTGSSDGTLSVVSINGSGNIVATTGATGVAMTGSFTGSFKGDGSQLTGVPATTPNALNSSTGISTFSFNGSSAGVTVSVSGAAQLSNTILTKWDSAAGKFVDSTLTDNGTTVSGASSIRLTGVNSSLTGSFTGSFSGSIAGGFVSTFNTRTGPVTLQASDISGLAAGIVSSSTFSSNTQGSFTSSINSVITNVNLGLTPSNAVVFNGVNSTSGLTGSLTASSLIGDIILGTQTSGSYVGTITAGNGISTTGAPGGEGIAHSISVRPGALITVANGLTSVNTSSLLSTQIPKYSADSLAGSNISDTGTQVQIGAGASSGLSVAAGGISVTGNSTFANTVNVQGDLIVAGTASFQNTQNLLIGDRFAAFASGAQSPVDAGIIVVQSTVGTTMSGSAFYLEVGTGTDTGTYGRFAVAPNVNITGSTLTADEWVVTAKQSTTAPSANTPTWGGNTVNAAGNMWIDTTNNNIYIWA